MTPLPTILYQVYTHWDKQLFSLRRHLGVRVPARPGQEDWGGSQILSCSAKPRPKWRGPRASQRCFSSWGRRKNGCLEGNHSDCITCVDICPRLLIWPVSLPIHYPSAAPPPPLHHHIEALKGVNKKLSAYVLQNEGIKGYRVCKSIRNRMTRIITCLIPFVGIWGEMYPNLTQGVAQTDQIQETDILHIIEYYPFQIWSLLFFFPPKI